MATESSALWQLGYLVGEVVVAFKPCAFKSAGLILFMNKKVYGGILGTIGFLLSPLSWWNDLFVNFPIAYVFACAANFFYKGAFLGAFIISYWLTNVMGFALLQKGIEKMSRDSEEKKRYSKKDLARDILLSLVYTVLIVVLVKLGVVKPIG